MDLRRRDYVVLEDGVLTSVLVAQLSAFSALHFSFTDIKNAGLQPYTSFRTIICSHMSAYD